MWTQRWIHSAGTASHPQLTAAHDAGQIVLAGLQDARVSREWHPRLGSPDAVDLIVAALAHHIGSVDQ